MWKEIAIKVSSLVNLKPPNLISFMRAPLAFLFVPASPLTRTIVVMVAMVTDYADGYLARRFFSTSKVGVVLDPVMDKFFVYVAAVVLFLEGKISTGHVMALISRDLFLLLFFVYIFGRGLWQKFTIRAIKWGKVTTGAQFIVLILLALGMTIPLLSLAPFIVLGGLSFAELLFCHPQHKGY